MYRLLAKPLFFLLPPEKAHHFTLSLVGILTAIPIVSSIFKSAFAIDNTGKGITLFGLKFKNKVGLAAGFDKDAKYIKHMSTLGFGFIEIGTVTPRPQTGNPKPRLFRLSADKGLINRMGFNNDGVDAAVERLKKLDPGDVVIGGNIGKNKTTPNEDAWKDYQVCFQKLFEHVDYFVVNVSSPNTPGLRALQGKDALHKILKTVQDENALQLHPKPVFVKLSPDLGNAGIDDAIDLCLSLGLKGIIATNTTIDRTGLTTDKYAIDQIGAGGLSGAPVRERSTEVIRYIKSQVGDRLTVIGVGGIDSPQAAKEKIAAGADLVQIYSGMIYEGPGIIKSIVKAL